MRTTGRVRRRLAGGRAEVDFADGRRLPCRDPFDVPPGFDVTVEQLGGVWTIIAV